MKKLYEQIKEYIPFNEQEQKDKDVMLHLLETQNNLFVRDNKTCHFSASAWVLNEDHTKAIMAYHNIYKSFSWLGGHADGNEDLLEVAIKETKEESGVKDVKVLSADIFSLEILTVDGHIKYGEYVPSHLHLNVTYLLEAKESQELSIKEDENSAIRWFPLEDAIESSNEEWMKNIIYRKLVDKVYKMNKED